MVEMVHRVRPKRVYLLHILCQEDSFFLFALLKSNVSKQLRLDQWFGLLVHNEVTTTHWIQPKKQKFILAKIIDPSRDVCSQYVMSDFAKKKKKKCN